MWQRGFRHKIPYEVIMKKTSSANKSPKRVRKKYQRRKSSPKKPVRLPGMDQGKIIIKPDFDAPLPEFES
jgi:hypothetical protein